MKQARVIRDPKDTKLDKFYDETPQLQFTFQLKLSNRSQPYELYYRERLDGDEDYRKQVMEDLKKRAQADMHNILQRVWAEDENAEFQEWRVLDQDGVVLHVSDELKIFVKPQVGGIKNVELPA